MPDCTDEELLTPEEVAGILKVSPRTLRNWRASGKGPPYLKLEGSVRYRRGDVRAWIRQARERAGGGRPNP